MVVLSFSARYGRVATSAGVVLAAAAVLTAGGRASATDGYFEHGYGVQSKGMGGVVLAYPKDALAIATNPAAAVALGDRADLDLDYFRPSRHASYSGTMLDESYSGDGRSKSFIPELALTHRLGDRWAVGLAVYGNGGMLTQYKDNPFARFGATGAAGVDLEQMFISPTVAYQIAPGHSLGVGLNIAGQRFKAQGIGVFAPMSVDPAHVSDTGAAISWGSGVKVGYLGQLTPRLSVGAFWQSKVWSGKFDRYAGLFADGGAFDVPSSWGVGVAFKALPNLDLAADVRRINYSEIPAAADPLGVLFTGHPLGSPGGPGWGWRDVTAVKLGANYRIAPAWQLRAGWDRASNPIPRDQTFLNILAPAVVRDHFTAGATWTHRSGLELSAYVMRAPTYTLRGKGSIPPAFGGGEANISLGETAVGIGLGWKN
jgi:long-chain fatty acid transport protein